MQSENAAAVGAARILNAAYMVRLYCRPHQRAQRARALRELAEVARRELAGATDPEAVLYAIAMGLYDRADARFLN